MSTIWFIRHGESEANAGLPSADPSSIPLTPLGREQAKRIALAFTFPPDRIVHSPYLRARQTAQPTIDRFPGTACEEWPVHEFTYLSILGGVSTTAERRPRVEKFWRRCDPEWVDGEGAESFANLMHRVEGTLQRLEVERPGLTAVFTHSQFIRLLLWMLITNTRRVPSVTTEHMRRARDFLASFELPNGSIMKVWLGEEEVRFTSTIVPGVLSTEPACEPRRE